MNKFRIWLAGKIAGQKLIYREENWKLLCIEKTDLNFNSDGRIEKGIVFFYFYETNLGRRRYEVKSNLKSLDQKQLDEFHKRWDIYLERIIPWLSGRYDKDIPAHRDVDVLDLVEKLSLS